MPRRYRRRLSAEFRQKDVVTPWYLRPFQVAMRHPAYLAVNRRSIAAAIGIGLFIGLLPLPFHTPMAVIAALLVRANLAVSVLAIWVANPITWGPLFYGEYRLGAWLLRQAPHQLPGGFSVTALAESFSGIWKPLFLGGGLLAVLAGGLGYLLTNALWRWSVTARYRRRHRGHDTTN